MVSRLGKLWTNVPMAIAFFSKLSNVPGLYLVMLPSLKKAG